MADTTPAPTRPRGRGFGRKSLALQGRMDTAAPIEQIDAPPTFDLPADPRVAPVTVLPHDGPLSDLVGPFVTVNAQPARPAFEYVPVSPSQLSPAVVAQQAFNPHLPQGPAPYPVQSQSGVAATPASTGTLGPQAPLAVPQPPAAQYSQGSYPPPAPAQAAYQTVAPAPIAAAQPQKAPQLRPVIFSPQGQPNQAAPGADIPARRNNVIAPMRHASPSKPQPPPWPASSGSPPAVASPSLAASLEAADRELSESMRKPVPRMQAMAAAPTPAKKHAKHVAYSHNSRHLNRTRQGMRAGNYAVAVIVLASVLGVFLYWRASGSPTSVESLPFVRSLAR